MARILIVDDDDIIAEIASDALTQAGHVVSVVDNGTDAVEAALTSRPDLLILDYTLPGKTGREILRELRAIPNVNDMPVMMLTSRHGRVHSGIAEIEGADDYMTKPFNTKDLVARVEALLVGVAIARRVTEAASAVMGKRSAC